MILIKILLVLLTSYGLASLIVNVIKDKEAPGLKFGIPSFIIGILGFVIISSLVRIGAQDVGVVVTPRGVTDEELHTGWHLIAPWNNVHKMDKTVWVYTRSHSTKEGAKSYSDAVWAPTKDGIKMGFDISVSWRIIPDEASWIYQNVSENDGEDGRYHWLEENVIRTKLTSAMALVVSTFTPIECYSYKRSDIQDLVIKKIREEVKDYRLQIDQVDLREVFYNPDYEASINSKKLAEQEALRLVEITKQKEEQLKQSRIDKDIAIQEAEGEAKALQIKGNAIIANPKIIQLEWIKKWDGALPSTSLGSGQGLILNLDK